MFLKSSTQKNDTLEQITLSVFPIIFSIDNRPPLAAPLPLPIFQFSTSRAPLILILIFSAFINCQPPRRMSFRLRMKFRRSRSPRFIIGRHLWRRRRRGVSEFNIPDRRVVSEGAQIGLTLLDFFRIAYWGVRMKCLCIRFGVFSFFFIIFKIFEYLSLLPCNKISNGTFV